MSAPDAGAGPDYTRAGTVFAYRWVPHRDGTDPDVIAQVQAELADALAVQAQREGSELTGAPDLDFPDPIRLPADVRRATAKIMRRQEPRPWRWPGMVLVRAWQDTIPATAPGAA